MCIGCFYLDVGTLDYLIQCCIGCFYLDVGTLDYLIQCCIGCFYLDVGTLDYLIQMRIGWQWMLLFSCRCNRLLNSDVYWMLLLFI